MRDKIDNTKDKKNKILDAEVEKMLHADNPLHGIYGLYGDCPNGDDPHLPPRKSAQKRKDDPSR